MGDGRGMLLDVAGWCWMLMNGVSAVYAGIWIHSKCSVATMVLASDASHIASSPTAMASLSPMPPCLWCSHPLWQILKRTSLAFSGRVGHKVVDALLRWAMPAVLYVVDCTDSSNCMQQSKLMAVDDTGGHHTLWDVGCR